jgi:hypothetical protein
MMLIAFKEPSNFWSDISIPEARILTQNQTYERTAEQYRL